MPGEIFDQFQTVIDELQTTSDNVSQALQGQEQRQWRTPPGWDSAPTDVPALGDGFVRDEINGTYQDYFNDGSAVNACMSAKIQLDHLAMQERAFRSRHMTHIRASIHAAARRNGQSQGGGSFDRILNQASDLLLDADTGV